MDVVGVGSGVADMLHRTGYKIIDFVGSEKTVNEGPGGIALSQ